MQSDLSLCISAVTSPLSLRLWRFCLQSTWVSSIGLVRIHFEYERGTCQWATQEYLFYHSNFVTSRTGRREKAKDCYTIISYYIAVFLSLSYESFWKRFQSDFRRFPLRLYCSTAAITSIVRLTQPKNNSSSFHFRACGNRHQGKHNQRME